MFAGGALVIKNVDFLTIKDNTMEENDSLYAGAMLIENPNINPTQFYLQTGNQINNNQAR